MNLTAQIAGCDVQQDGWPTVAVVMPIRNEEAHLETAVKSILAQDYPEPFEVCLAVGPSDDATEAVAERLAGEYPAVSVVANPTGITPAGLNAAIAATKSDVVVRVDGHSVLSDGYIRTAVETMIKTGAVNVGGMQKAVGTTPFERTVASAMSSRIGTGGAKFHVGGDPGPVDTVYLGVFDRAAGDAVGWFDDRLIRNQDYELNIRLRNAGGTIWFTPELSVEYRPRSTWRGLAKQYYEYGYWKAQVARLHPRSLRPRQLIPALLAPALVTAAALTLRYRRAVAIPAAYVAALFTATRSATIVPVLATQHLSWSVGAFVGYLRSRLPVGRSDNNTHRALDEVHLVDNLTQLLLAVADLASRTRPSRVLILFIDDHIQLDEPTRTCLESVAKVEIERISDKAAIAEFAAPMERMPGVVRRNFSFRGVRPITPRRWRPRRLSSLRFETAYIYHPGFFLSKVLAGSSGEVVMRDAGYCNYVELPVTRSKRLLRFLAGYPSARRVWGEERWIDRIEVGRPLDVPERVRNKATKLSFEDLFERLGAVTSKRIALCFWGETAPPVDARRPSALLLTQPIDSLGFCSTESKHNLFADLAAQLSEAGYHVVTKHHPREQDPATISSDEIPRRFPIEAWTWLGHHRFDLAVSLNSASLIAASTFASEAIQLIEPERFFADYFPDWGADQILRSELARDSLTD